MVRRLFKMLSILLNLLFVASCLFGNVGSQTNPQGVQSPDMYFMIHPKEGPRNSSSFPNVVVLVADDLGYGDLGCYGNDIKTPNIDGLAQNGMKFNRMYSMTSDAASMYALLTGRNPLRRGLLQGSQNWPSFSSLAQLGGLKQEDFTIGTVFDEVKDTAAFIGRWSLGFRGGVLATGNGFNFFHGTVLSHGPACTSDPKYRLTDFDYFLNGLISNMYILSTLTVIFVTLKYFGYIGRRGSFVSVSTVGIAILLFRIYCWSLLLNPNSCILMQNNTILEQPYDDTNITLRMTREALRVIKDDSKPGKPFLMVMSFLQPKVPSLRSSLFNNKSGIGPYYDAVLEMDWSVGKIINALKESGKYENTLIIFTSDNGPELTDPIFHTRHGKEMAGSPGFLIGNKKRQLKFRGEKGSNMEGGIRVPAILHWPGHIQPGTETNIVTSIMDIYPTLAAIYKFKWPQLLDGKSLVHLFKNPTSSQHHRFLPHYCEMYRAGAVTYGDLKLHFTSGWTEDTCRGQTHFIPLVYNITADPGETTPLPQAVAEPLGYEVRMMMKKYEMSMSSPLARHSQFDELPWPWQFPCNGYISCGTNTEGMEINFDSLIQQ